MCEGTGLKSADGLKFVFLDRGAADTIHNKAMYNDGFAYNDDDSSNFDLPTQKLARWLKRDEHDMRPYAEEIVEKALKRLEVTPDEPLILLIGESHNMPSHPVIQMLVLKMLQDRRLNVSFGREMSHDLLFRRFCKQAGRGEESGIFSDYVMSHDLDGLLSLQALIGFENNLYIEDTNKTLLNFMIKKGVSTRFNDAASRAADTQYMLDDRDIQTERLIRDLYPEHAEHLIGVIEKEGMHIRNHMIVQKALSHAKRTQARIYVQQCGFNHLVGKSKYLYQHSLSALFKEAQRSVLVVPLESSSFGKNKGNSDYNLRDNEILWGLNPPEKRFKNNDNPEEQKIYLKELLKASGFDPALADIDDVIDKHKEEMTAHFARWDKVARKFSANDAGLLPALSYAMSRL